MGNCSLIKKIAYIDKKMKWEEIFASDAKYLEEHKYILPSYTTSVYMAMADNPLQFAVMPNVIVQHAAPNDGVLSSGMVVSFSKYPVSFDGLQQSFQLFVLIASKNSTEHLENLQCVAKMLSNIDCILNSNSIDTLQRCIKQSIKE